MKHAIFLYLFLISAGVQAGLPEVILPRTKVIHPAVWYADQSRGWKEETIRNKKDPQAWLNLYLASRYGALPPDDLDQIARDMESAIPGSFETLLVEGWKEGYTAKAHDLFNRAYALKPADPASYLSLILFNELDMNHAARKDFSHQIFKSGLISESLLNYSYNVLMSLDRNAILFTEGESATVPLYVLQDVMNVRGDVSVMNLDLLLNAAYREKKFDELNIKAALLTTSVDAERKRQLCALLPAANQDRGFYYALTLSRDNIDQIKDQLYVVGLASRLSKERLDNIAVIKENLEKKFLLDYLTVDFNGENEWAAGKALNSNYLVPLLLLTDHYARNGSREASHPLEQLVIKLAREGGKTELINNFLNREPRLLFTPYPLKVKELEDGFKIIRGKLYAQKTEVTNGQYNEFLRALRLSNQQELLTKYAFDLSQYTEPATAFMKMYHSPMQPFVKQVSYANHPAVNISYESAVAYCEWLSDQYNNSAKRKFHKVKFRLPSIREWQIAALGYPQFQSWDLDDNTVIVPEPEDSLMEIGSGKKISVSVRDVLYPWWGAHNYRKKAQNKRNCWLGNFKVPEDCKPCQAPKAGGDGFEMMGQVASYFPNGMGFYDVSGNVAEMTEEKGKACGGSWNHPPLESTIKSINTFSGPDAAVGFRVFMDVIEP